MDKPPSGAAATAYDAPSDRSSGPEEGRPERLEPRPSPAPSPATGPRRWLVSPMPRRARSRPVRARAPVPGREGTPSMDPRTAATRVPDPDAVEFIRFCYGRRRVGWPELYDEMCAVAAAACSAAMGPTIWPSTASASACSTCRPSPPCRPGRRRGAGAPPTGRGGDHRRGRRVDGRRAGRTGPRRRCRSSPPPVLSSNPSPSTFPSASLRCPPGPDPARSHPEAPPAWPSGASSSAAGRRGRRVRQARMRRLAISPSIWRSAST